jgi:hypothetical protein
VESHPHPTIKPPKNPFKATGYPNRALSSRLPHRRNPRYGVRVPWRCISLHNNQDHTNQIGFIISLMDRTARCCVLQFSSRKSRRVPRSSMAFRIEHNAADAITKMAQNAAWQEILHPHRVSHLLEQYVIDTRLFSDNCTGK